MYKSDILSRITKYAKKLLHGFSCIFDTKSNFKIGLCIVFSGKFANLLFQFLCVMSMQLDEE